MARIKNSPEVVQKKYSLAERLRVLRVEKYGERGGPELARQLGVPIRTWYNYESGITVPAEVVLRLVELTGVEPLWLLNGQGDSGVSKLGDQSTNCAQPARFTSAESHLREALRQLESRLEVDGATPRRQRSPDAVNGKHQETDTSEHATGFGGTNCPNPDGQRSAVSHRAWGEEEVALCVRVFGEDMAPVLGDGAYVAFSELAVDPIELHSKLVVAWIQGKPIVRWYQFAGSHAILVAENLTAAPTSILVPLVRESEHDKIRRVLWVTTPH